MTEENVKVAVRVRPFNQREIDAKCKLVVSMAGNQTIMVNPKTNEEKKFAYDFSYWSHDSFKTESNGYLSSTNSKYADQKKVYADLGAGVLKNAWNGFNASLFAYGQTGSGKSYSVVGYGANKGIVPMVCEEIFKGEADAKKAGKTVEVTFSMLEIYSEIVRDLLNSKADRKAGLTVREDPKLGFYAQGQSKILVDDYGDISKLMDEGNANRTIAATNMNATSSRAHTIVTITLVQKYKNDAGKEMAKSSVMNLVDLAGSERADQTGATGDRLKEGAAINLSLTALGNVISALADNSQGKNVRVPYRDSQLTKLLMNALGGNSKTIMIAAISPADMNFDESISTLRYADRAKQIKTKAVVNEDPTEKLISDLKAENARLKKLLEDSKVDPSLLAKSGAAAGGAAADGKPVDHTAEEAALKKQVEENEKNMKLMQQSYEEKLAAAKASTANFESSKTLEKAKTVPHLRNINMDPTLCGTIKILLEGEGTKVIGLLGKADIGLNGFGILEKHAGITNKGGKFLLERYGDARVLRNGKLITLPTDLNHLDRLVFGTTQYFVFTDPSKATANQPYYDFQAMQDEIGRESGIVNKSNQQNMSQDEIRCQNELLDLIPAIEEANQISITLDKKVMFKALMVSPQARGEYEGKFQPYVLMKNLANGCEWLWPKEKFIARKIDITEMMDDFNDDGKINREKFKKYDPFSEDPDTPYQIGTSMIFPKSFAYLISTKSDFKIVNHSSQEMGLLSAEILPCNSQGKVITQQDGIVINDPKKDLANKNVSFIIKITAIKNLSPTFENVWCQFTIFDDKTLYKTEKVKGGEKGKALEFKFSTQLNYVASPEFLDKILNKCFYIQIWADQKPTKVDKGKASTQDYFDRLFGMVEHFVYKDEIGAVDPETQKLRDDLYIATTQNERSQLVIQNVSRLSQAAGNSAIPGDILKRVLAAKTADDANNIIKDYAKNSNNKVEAKPQQQQDPKGSARSGTPTSQACVIL